MTTTKKYWPRIFSPYFVMSQKCCKCFMVERACKLPFLFKCWIWEKLLNPFLPNVPPFDPPENIRKPKVFWCFQGDQKEILGIKRVKLRPNEVASALLTLISYVTPFLCTWWSGWIQPRTGFRTKLPEAFHSSLNDPFFLFLRKTFILYYLHL